MRGLHALARVILAALFVTSLSLAGCTTTIQPITCKGGPYRCNEDSRDVKFCEREAIAVAGRDCADVGLAPSKHFCIVKREDEACSDEQYELKRRDCKVQEYRAVREWRECSPGTPTFAP
jgi:hypothetical protein